MDTPTITVVCDNPDHRRPIARFFRNAEGDWEARKGGSWIVETRGTDTLSESVTSNPVTGKSVRRRTFVPARDRWMMWCLTCNGGVYPPRSGVVECTAATIDAALSALSADGEARVTLKKIRNTLARKAPKPR